MYALDVRLLACTFTCSVLYGVQVDAHNIVPCWEASDKAEEAAYLMRGQLQKHVHKYMTEFPPVIQHPYPIETQVNTL